MGSYCPVCNKKFSKDGYATSSKHLDSKAHKDAMRKKNRSSTAKSTQRSTPTQKSISGQKFQISPTPASYKLLEKRVKDLENQVQFLFSQVRDLSRGNKNSKLFVNEDDLKHKIQNIITNFQQISVDQLFAHSLLHGTPSKKIENVVLELSADSFIDLGEGVSKRKIKGKYGLMILH